MLEPIGGLPSGTIGFRAIGTVEPGDYKNVLDPAIEEAIHQHGKVNLLYVLGPDFDRYSAGAIWQDAKLAGKSPRTWGRLAFVTDHEWLGHAVSFASFLIPGEAKVFPLGDEAAAISWLGEDQG